MRRRSSSSKKGAARSNVSLPACLVCVRARVCACVCVCVCVQECHTQQCQHAEAHIMQAFDLNPEA